MKIKTYLERLPSLEGQNVVITGTTSGLGYALSELVLAKGAHLIMANRHSNRVREALNALKETFPDGKITSLTLDQSDTVAIDSFVTTLLATKVKINAFVFNAGVYLPDETLRTNSNLALTFGVNYFGNYYLTEKLYAANIIDKTTRLVYTTSIAAAKKLSERCVNHLFNNTVPKRHYEYKYAKTALNIYAQHLMETKENNIYLYHPGVSGTNIVRFRSKLITMIARFFMRLLFPPPHKAALGALFALTTEQQSKNKIIVPRGAFNIVGYPKFKLLKIKKNTASVLLLKLSEEKAR